MKDIHTGFSTQCDEVVYVVAFNVGEDGAVTIVQGVLVAGDVAASNSSVYSGSRAYSQ